MRTRIRHRRDHRYGVGGLLAIATLSCAVLAPPALAQGELPADNSGIDEYVESLPAAEGKRDPSGGSRSGSDPSGGSRSARLPERIRRALPPGREGQILERIATAGALGAPVGAGAPETSTPSTESDGDGSDDGGGGGGAPGGGSSGGGDEGALSAVGSTVADSDTPAIPILVGLLVLITALAAVVALRLRSRRSKG